LTQNLEESVKVVKNALEAGGVFADTVSRNNDGHIIVRNGFFYKSGRTAEGHTHKIKKALEAAGIKHSIVDDGEHNAPFRGGASVARNSHFYTHIKLHEETINEVSKDLLKRYVAKGDRSYDQLNDKAYNAWKSSDDLRDNPAAYKKTTDAAVKLGRKADRRALSLNKADARLAEEMTTSQRHDKHYDEQPEHVKNNLNTHLRNGMTYPDAVAREVGKHQGATPLNEAYPSAAAMARKAKAVKQARAVANGYANQKSGKWSSQSYKTEDGRWASKDVKEETLVERYRRATGRTALIEASAETLVATKGSDKASRYEMHTRMPGEASEYSSIIKTHQDGKPLQNQWGGYNTLRTGKTAYVKKHFDKLDEEVITELSKGTLGSYIKKASNDVASKAVEYGTKKAERDEVDRITNRHMKYADKDTIHKALKTTSDDVEGPRVKAAKRIGGISKAVNKLTSEDVQLDELAEEAVTHGDYSIKSSKLHNAQLENGEPDHVRGHRGSIKALGISTKKGDKYGQAHLVSVTNNKTGQTTNHSVYQREWYSGSCPTLSIKGYGNRKPGHDQHHNALASYLEGKHLNEEALNEAPYYSLEASKARMAKEKARAAAKAAIAAAKADSSIARKEARENRSLHIARHIEAEVGNHYPDSDGFEAISNKVRKMGIPHHEVIDHLDKAARKHLGAKSFDHYVDNFHKDAQGSN